MQHPLPIGTKILYRVPHGCGCSGKWEQKHNSIKSVKIDRNIHFYTLYSGETIPQTQVDNIIA